jgi:hypothetical protein
MLPDVALHRSLEFSRFSSMDGSAIVNTLDLVHNCNIDPHILLRGRVDVNTHAQPFDTPSWLRRYDDRLTCLRSNRIQRYLRPFTHRAPSNDGCIHSRIPYYSYLSASIGSNLEAFIAGHIPKTNPIPTETLMPAIGAHAGT